MKKRAWKSRIAFLLCAALALTAFMNYFPDGVEAYAEEVQADENGFVIENGVLTQYTGTAEEVVIPKGVTGIGDGAFYGCESLVNISIPEGVTSIGNDAFSYCNSLTEVTIPDSVTSIGAWAFEDCNSLKNINIPESMQEIGDYAFYGCSHLVSVRIPKSVILMETPFSYCESLEEIVVEEGNPVYDSRGNCNAIIESETNTLISGCSKTIIPESVTSIGSSAFSGCSGLTNIVIPEGVTSIGYLSFANCSSLTSIEIPRKVTNIEFNTFSGCSSLKSIELPENILCIDEWAFSDCSALEGIYIPKSITEIGNGAFSGCDRMESMAVEEGNPVYDSRGNCNAIIESETNTLISGCSKTIIPESVTGLDINAFRDCRTLKSIHIPENVAEIDFYAFLGCTALESINIPPAVTTLHDKSFLGCESLKSIVIPKNLTNIGFYVFESCSALESIVVEEGNPVYDSRGNCNAIIESETNTLISGCSKTIIPESVTSIGDSAFSGCKALTGMRIPEGITNIGYEAFENCSSLTSVTIPESVTSIESFAFFGCEKLTLYGIEGSYVQKYAQNNKIAFIPMILLENGKTNISETQVQNLLEKNKTQDTVLRTAEGITFTFEQGSMALVDGKDSYDFGAQISRDYSTLADPPFAEDEFAFKIDYNYEGRLPGKAKIAIPVDEKFIGERLYYYEIGENGEYAYMGRTTAAQDGTYTVEQEHCSAYAATTKAPENLGNVDGVGGITTDDALIILKQAVGMAQTGYHMELADCDGADGITTDDALLVLKRAVGMEVELF